MSRKKRSKRSTVPPSPIRNRPDYPRESQATEAATVAWMLAFLTTLTAEILAPLVRLAIGPNPSNEQTLSAVYALPHLLWGVAMLCGPICLVLSVVVVIWRRVAAPRSIILAAWVVSLLPLVSLWRR